MLTAIVGVALGCVMKDTESSVLKRVVLPD